MAASKILVVDDVPDSVQLLEDILVAEGYQVITAYDGAQALDKAFSEQPNVILLDVMMPKLDGYEVCRRLKQSEAMRFTPVVLITILQDIDSKIKGLEAGADEFLSKPFNRLELLTRVRALLRTNRLHQELQRSYEELRRLEGLRDDLLAMIVHDLRSPLTIILGTLEVLAEDLRDTLAPEQTHAIDVAIRAARRQMDLIHDLLDLQRLEEGKIPLSPHCTDLSKVIRSAMTEATVQAGWREVALHVALPADLPPVRADAALVERVLNNLLDNALRHTPAGGQVRISAEVVGGDPSSAPLKARDEGEGTDRSPQAGQQQVVIHVADTGTGVPEQHREAIFDKYQQAMSRRIGSRGSAGLGLAFCRMAVEAQGGRIWVDNQPGWGAVFSFTLPLFSGQVAAADGQTQ